MCSKKLIKGRISIENPHFEFDRVNRLNKRLSEELHDNVSAKLSVIRFKLIHNPFEVLEAVELLDNLIVRVRKISHNLYSPSLEHLSFTEAVQDFLIPLHEVIPIEIHNTHKQSQNLDSRTQFLLFRIFQEVIANILKHAKANTISICLRFSKRKFSFSIRDNGIGFLKDSRNRIGIGLKNIDYRANELNAKYKFKTQINVGTLFIISVPVN